MSVERTNRASRRPRISFQSRITGVAMITAVAVLLAASAVFLAEQWRADQDGAMALQAAVAEPFATGPTLRAVYKGEAPAAPAASKLLQRHRAFRAVFLFDQRGLMISRAGADSPDTIQDRGLMQVSSPVVVDGRVVGQLVTFTAAPSIWPLLPRYLALTAVLLFAATGLALFLGRWLAGRVTHPVNRLSEAMRAVARGGDFTQRVERLADDELGRLTDSFNALLARLHANDQALRQTMEELVEARDSAQSANRLKSQFLANMSHEIRTPLNGLLAMAQVMALEDLGPVQGSRLEVIRHSGETLLTILNDVLDVSKIEAGKLELEVDDFDTETVMRAALAPFGAMAERKGVILALDLAPAAKGLRRGDPVRLSQIVGNLVSNALKFTEVGEVRVTVHGLDDADTGEAGAAGIVVAVSDTGVGIAADALPLLFQTFTQADNSITRRFGGTGLGLAICNELSQRMGGWVCVGSELGQGSVFTLSLPLQRVAAAAPAPAAVRVSSEPAAHEDRPIRVLAAEDNATNQLVLTTVMGIFGADLTLVGDGAQAVEAWRDGDFDLILMDIQMPVMDGLTAARAIRAEELETRRRRIPIIALSAHAMIHQVREYLAAGLDLHVAKPIELPRLQAALAEAVALGAAAPDPQADHGDEAAA